MSKVLLVHCMEFNRSASGRNRHSLYVPPLGICYIGAYLRKKGLDVKLLELSALDGWQEFIEILTKYDPRIVGLSAMTPSIESAYQAAEIVHRTITGAKVVIGGAHATVCPDSVISNPHVDFVIRGEGEITFFELCDALLNGSDLSQIDGVTYRQDNGIRMNKPRAPIARLDDLPFPARDIIGTEGSHTYAYKLLFPMPYPYMNIISSRGCLARCNMCQPTLDMIFGKGIRHRSAMNVVEEMKMLKKEYSIRSAIFWDDTFTMDQQWLDEFCYILSESQLNISWWCYARVNTVHEAMLRKMKRSGCVMICFGIESGSQRILTEVLNKATTVEQNRKAIALCKKVGLLVNANVMIGSPTETLEEIKLTDRLLTETGPELVWAAVTSPLPGTYLGDDAIRNDMVLAEDWSDYQRGQTGKPKMKTEAPWEAISYYQAKWHTTGFKWKFIPEPHYLRACIVRCLCHIKMRKFAAIYDDFFSASWGSVKQELRKIPYIYSIYLRYKQWARRHE